RFQKHGVNDGKNSGICTNADRKAQDSRYRETGGFAEISNGVPRILDQIFKPYSAPGSADFFLYKSLIAESAPCRVLGVSRGKTTLQPPVPDLSAVHALSLHRDFLC